MINLAAINKLLRPGLNAVFGDYHTYKDEWTEIFKTYQSDKNYEEDVEMRFFGPADIKTEGAPMATDTMGQRVSYVYRHLRLANSGIMTRETLEDNLYKSQFPQQANSLKQSLKYTKNILGANVLNNAFNAAYPGGDGVPLCSTAHPIDGGTFANTFAQGGVNVDFSEAGVEQAIILIGQFPAQSGMLTATMAEKIIVPPQLQFAASRLLNSAFRTDTANNDISAIYHNSYLPKGYAINHFLTSPAAWFILTNADNGFKHFQRTPVETDTYVDFSTMSIQFSATERYSFGYSNVRCVFGSPGV